MTNLVRCACGLSLSGALLFGSADARAQTARLLKDINTGSTTASNSAASRFVELNGLGYFLGSSSTTSIGTEIFRTDGTASGTYPVGDFGNGAGGAALTVVAGKMYFAYDTGSSGYEPWVSDGSTAGTSLLKEIRSGSTASITNSTSFVAVGSQVLFAADDGTNGNELWATNGTAAGTVLVKDINSGSAASAPTSLTACNGVLFFSATTAAAGAELWKSDGTDAGTVLVKDIRAGTASSTPNALVCVGSTLYFAATISSSGTELYKSDGTDAGTVLVADIFAGVSPSTPLGLTAFGSKILFSAITSTGRELEILDTASGDSLTRVEIASGTASSSPSLFTVVGSTAYFVATTSATGVELWTTDGTSAGTSMVTDINGTNANSVSTTVPLVPLGSRVVFAATGATGGQEPWISDGTAAGTVRLKDVNPGSSGSSPTGFAPFGTKLLFQASNGTTTNGTEPWMTDGTESGTQMLANLSADGAGQNNLALVCGGTYYAYAADGAGDTELWKSDGTAATTLRVKDVRIGGSSSAFPRGCLGDNVLFAADDGTNGAELWKSDGTLAGTTLVKDILAGSGGSQPQPGVAALGAFYFMADRTGSLDWEPFKSDGTAAGTSLLADINPSGASNPSGFVQLGAEVLFLANDGTSGQELWKTNGTTTAMVKDVQPGASSGVSILSAVYNGAVYLRASDGINGFELWKTDGTSAGTVMLKDINPGSADSSPGPFVIAGGRLFFAATDATHGTELWSTDGTSAGTAMVKDIVPGSTGATLSRMFAVGSTVFFWATTAAEGSELWKSDGTDAGTVLVKDIAPGSRGSNYNVVGTTASWQGVAYFSADDFVHGVELWRSDGTAEGTVMVADINEGFGTANPITLLPAGNRFYFFANDGTHGREPYVLLQPSPALGARFADAQVQIDWLNPAVAYGTTRVCWSTLGFPTDPTAGGQSCVTRTGTAGARDALVHDGSAPGGITNGTKYFYTSFVNTVADASGAWWELGRSRARPFPASPDLKWAFSSNGSTLAPAGIITESARVFTVSNDRNVHAGNAGDGGGAWPSGFIPPLLSDYAMARPTVVKLRGSNVLGATELALVSTNDGRVNLLDATTGDLLWVSPKLGPSVFGSPAAMFTDLAAPMNFVLAASRNATGDSKVYGLGMSDGQVAWTFDNGGGASGIGPIAGNIALDVAGQKAYFASRAKPGGSPDTLWAVSFTATSVTKLWSSAAYGEIDGAPVLRGGVLFVGSNGGTVHAVNPADGTARWTGGYATGDGPVKGFVWPDTSVTPPRLYFATSTMVHAIQDNGAGTAPTAAFPAVSVPGPSPLVVVGGRIYVGAGDGRLWQIEIATQATASRMLGDPLEPKVAGAPTYDVLRQRIVVGTDTGDVWATGVPF